MNIKQKVTTAIALGTLAASVLAPASAMAATTVNISTNGFGSKNGAAVISAKKSVVKQTNNTTVNSTVISKSNTGKNSSSFNTGGTNSITTGGTVTAVAIGVTGNTNTNTSLGCCCDGENGGTTDVTISNNGAFSWNGALVVDLCKNVVKQTNNTTVNTTVISSSNTGGNSSSFNTDGANSINTGATETGVIVTVEGGSNTN